MASTIHDERPSTSSSHVSSENSKTNNFSSTTTTIRPSPGSTTMSSSMAAPILQQQQYWHGPYGSNNMQTTNYSNFPRNIGHWQTGGGGPIANGFNTRAFNQIPLNWTPQQPRNFLPQAPFYIQPNVVPPLQWNTYGYPYTQQPPPLPNIMHQQPPPPWTPSPLQHQHQIQQPQHPAMKSNNLAAVIIDNTRDQQQQKPSGPNECWNNAVVAWEQRTMIHNKIGLIVNDRYRIVQNIDSGSYGTIFVAEDLKKNNERVAVKFDAASKDDHLKYEYEVYKSALYDDGCVKIEGFPRVYWFGNQFGHNVLVMELLGPPISSLFNFCERKFGIQTILLLGESMIRRIQHLHQRGFIHRDLKLENFLMGLAENETICYLIDFGLARRYRYRDGRQLKHIPFRKGRSFVGTAKYASLNSHKNAELSRRDDVESLGYVLIELINGSLPWKKLKVRNAYSTKHQMYIKIRNMKEQASWVDICPAMSEWMSYCKKLSFTDEPDYEHLLKILRKIPEIIQSNNVKSLSDSIQDLCIDDDPRCSTCRQRDGAGKTASTTAPLSAPTTTKMFKEKDEDEENSSNSSSSSDNETQQIICNEKISRERKLSKSASMSIVNTLNPQESLSTIPTTKPYADSVSDSKTAPLPPHQLEDDTASITSTCRKCRQRRQKYLDDRCAVTGAKYSWQVWKDATPELKFQYENRFSWTLPEYQIQDNRLLQNQPIYFHAPPVQQQQLQQQNPHQQQQIQQSYQKHGMLFSAPPPPRQQYQQMR
uniref:Protein kinase domain-containing protein n=1 Tax=Panagrolaimus sp. ES5 TaxID=591445 RepID=A0AC34GSI8_9BILA